MKHFTMSADTKVLVKDLMNGCKAGLNYVAHRGRGRSEMERTQLMEYLMTRILDAERVLGCSGPKDEVE